MLNTEFDHLLDKAQKLHFMGIGGSGMCPLAEILHAWGYEITGSDNNTGDNIDKLRSMGVKVILGQKPENIEGAEIIIYTSAILETNKELIAAKNSGTPCFERNKLFLLNL